MKTDPMRAHELIASRHPDLIAQFIPQAYQPEEIPAYRELGFVDVVWTLYKFGKSSDRVLGAVKETAPSGIVMPISFAMAGLLQTVTSGTGLPVYVHTVNNPELASCLYALGASGLYSDSLGLSELSELPEAPADCHPVASH